MVNDSGSGQSDRTAKSSMTTYAMYGMLIGLVIGAGIGGAADNVSRGTGTGLVMGFAIGLALGALVDLRRERQDKSDDR